MPMGPERALKGPIKSYRSLSTDKDTPRTVEKATKKSYRGTSRLADAKKHNKEGIKHWGMGHYDVALGHFKEASKIDGSSGEIHFNEAISYDKLGQHGVATKHFGVAKKKASGKNKEKLLKSPILNGHLN